MRLLKYDTFEPSANLAMEEALLEEVQRSGRAWLRLWRNNPSLIIGRFQCAQAEVNLAEARLMGIPVVRRLTGGGAVYHDWGNLNYSLAVPASAWSGEGFRTLLQPLKDVLARRGLAVSEGGRNDLTINGRKFSGAAGCRKGGAVLAHACILYDADLDKMERLLTAAPDKLQSHGVQSVRARVANLKNWLPPELDLTALAGELAVRFKARPAKAPERLLARARFWAGERYSARAWNIGFSAAFNQKLAGRFGWGRLEVFLKVENGFIKKARVRGDFFGPGPKPVELALTGRPYEPRPMREALASLDLAGIFPGADPEEILGIVGA